MMRAGAKALQTLAGVPGLKESLLKLGTVGGLRTMMTLKDVLEAKIPVEQVNSARVACRTWAAGGDAVNPSQTLKDRLAAGTERVLGGWVCQTRRRCAR